MLKRNELEKCLKTIPLFHYFDEAAIETLLDFGTAEYFSPESLLCTENEMDDRIFVILSGHVDILMTQRKKQVYLCSFGAGDVVGEAGIFYKVGRTATVQAKSEVVTLAITRTMLFEFIKNFPIYGVQFLMIIIYSQIKKCKSLNTDLAYERKEDLTQEEIDAMVQEVMSRVKGG